MANAWDPYIDNLVAKGTTNGITNLEKAAIIGKEGASWTSSSHSGALALRPEEILAIKAAFDNGDLSQFQTNGFHVEGTQYKFLRRVDDEEDKLDCFMGKKVKVGSITIQQTKKAFIVAFTPEGKQMGTTNTAVADIAEYLKGLNY